ncbi:MAG: hypothetical protein UH081_03525 [Clostridia bacterium]|nr:hypothetical protein [Clostridia bacterium]
MSKEQIIKFLKNKNNALIVVILIIGVIIMMSAGGESSKKTEPEQEGISYAKELENILADIEGAGKVKVMITYYGTSQKDIAYETKTNKSEGERTSEDRKAVISDGVPMVVRETYPGVRGVVVTAQGADNAAVKRKLTEAVTAALDVPEYRVCICKSK